MSLGTWRWCQGDLLLLCSDGLSDALDDGALEKTLNGLLRAAGGTLHPVAQGLLTTALAAGSRDDITVVLAGDSLPVHSAH
jgi:protein phosphatase